jgi:hypothetical protein
MHAGRKADEFENWSNTTGIRAPSFSGEHAIDAWEGKGGGPAGALGARDLAATALADNAGWRASYTVGWLANHPRNGTPKGDGALAIALALADNNDEEDHILRCLGAAVITRWNTIPTKLQKELFDNASSMGELLQTDVLKGQIARFLHKHKDDAG